MTYAIIAYVVTILLWLLYQTALGRRIRGALDRH
jgi:branched-subunit amino acid ABC-type transport system permease component